MGGLIATRRQSPQASIVDDGRGDTRFSYALIRFNEYRSRDDYESVVMHEEKLH